MVGTIDGRHDRWRDDQPGEHERTHHRPQPITSPLDHEADHRRKQHDQRHRGDGQDQAVAHRGDHEVVAEADDLEEVVHEEPVGWQRELQPGGLGLVLGRGEHDEHERHDEDDPDDEQGNGVEPPLLHETNNAHSSSSLLEKKRISG
jgi:hypothetical protein